jgi:hypothetical protein
MSLHDVIFKEPEIVKANDPSSHSKDVSEHGVEAPTPGMKG